MDSSVGQWTWRQIKEYSYLNNDKEKMDYISIASEIYDHNKRSKICVIQVLETEKKWYSAEKC